MAGIPVTITGMMVYSDLGVGGGPMPGGPPLGFWGGRPPNYIDIGGPSPQPPPGVPTHPIAYPPWWPGHPTHPIPPTVWPQPPGGGGSPPLGTWGGDAPWPGYATPPIAPGGPPPFPAHPIPPTVWPTPPGSGEKPPWWPGFPAHPIPPTVWPTPPEKPPAWWPGFPAHPIPPVIWGDPILPPEGTTPPDAGTPPIDWKVAWSPATGWIVVGVPNAPHPAPAK